MSQTGWTDKRPKSPHLTVWRWHVTMLNSILHRATGVANYVGAFVVVAWLFAAASGPETYALFETQAGTWYGQLILFGFTLSITFHLFNGLRFLFLDAGNGFEAGTARLISWIVLVISVLAAVAIWVLAGLVPGIVI